MSYFQEITFNLTFDHKKSERSTRRSKQVITTRRSTAHSVVESFLLCSLSKGNDGTSSADIPGDLGFPPPSTLPRTWAKYRPESSTSPTSYPSLMVQWAWTPVITVIYTHQGLVFTSYTSTVLQLRCTLTTEGRVQKLLHITADHDRCVLQKSYHECPEGNTTQMSCSCLYWLLLLVWSVRCDRKRNNSQITVSDGVTITLSPPPPFCPICAPTLLLLWPFRCFSWCSDQGARPPETCVGLHCRLRSPLPP